MCGFSALFSIKGIEPSHLIKMNDAIIHRGPDGEGYFLHQTELTSSSFFKCSKALLADREISSIKKFNALIGHRRLAIVDLSDSGIQPMLSDDSRYVIAFNGEIYNYKELKDDLIQKGYIFNSTCDTEVLLKAYIEWGELVLPKLNGMFAFQIFDTTKNTVFGARDRFGVKPLYYWKSGSFIALASEIKQFTVLPNWDAQINSARVYDFIQYGQTDHTDETLFNGVKQIPPGHSFKFDLNDLSDVKIRRWYDVTNTQHKTTLKAAKIKFKELFKDSIKLRLQADVPVGTGLSGGMDSSSIACEINSVLKDIGKDSLQKTFSAYTEVEQFDERGYINEVLDVVTAQPHFIELKCPDNLDYLDKVVWHQDEPFGTTSIFAEWSVFELAKSKKVKVTLDGHGADETLAGYHKFFFVYLFELLKKGKLVRFYKEVRALKKLHNYNVLQVAKTIGYILKKSIFSSQISDAWFKFKIDSDEINKVSFSLIDESKQQLLKTSVPMQMHWCDRDSMAHSVESRAPFLDYRLVEFILSCPSHLKIKDGKTKYILRESLEGLLPKNIYERISKIGFATPEANWMSENQSFFLSLLEEAKINLDFLINDAAFQKAEQIIKGKIKYDGFAWRIICLSIWVNVFQVKKKNVT